MVYSAILSYHTLPVLPRVSDVKTAWVISAQAVWLLPYQGDQIGVVTEIDQVVQHQNVGY